MQWNLKNKLGFFFVFIMLAAGVGMGVLYTISVTTQEQLISGASKASKNIQISGEDGIDNVLLVRELQSAMLEQMLLWKNFLVRGKCQDMQTKYAEAFEKGDARIVAMLWGDFLLVEAATPMEEVVRRIKALLEAITQKSIQLAKGANPLSGLPGNEFIQRTVATFLQRKVNFDVCYIDIDDFKPYNDYYGLKRGTWSSAAELAFLASGVKRAAKQEKGSAIVRNRREEVKSEMLRETD